MGSTRLVMGGRSLPLLYVSPGQINALVPPDLEPNTRHQLLVRRANTYARPVPVDVAPAQPAVFLAGSPAQGHIYFARGGALTLASPANPARQGDVLVMYVSGLGATMPAVGSGEQTPSSPLSRLAEPLSLTIGGIEAPVDFAGLAPGFAGLYQVNGRVPPGVPSGDAVEVRLTTGGQSSPPVTMAVQ
jgi:uncharacterized protein (TIGR03437 family)